MKFILSFLFVSSSIMAQTSTNKNVDKVREQEEFYKNSNKTTNGQQKLENLKVDQDSLQYPLKGVKPEDYSKQAEQQMKDVGYNVLPAKTAEYYYGLVDTVIEEGRLVLKNTNRQVPVKSVIFDSYNAGHEFTALAIQKLSTCGVRNFEMISFKGKEKYENSLVFYRCDNICWGISSIDEPKKDGKVTSPTVLNEVFCKALWSGDIPVSSK